MLHLSQQWETLQRHYWPTMWLKIKMLILTGLISEQYIIYFRLQLFNKFFFKKFVTPSSLIKWLYLYPSLAIYNFLQNRGSNMAKNAFAKDSKDISVANLPTQLVKDILKCYKD